MRVANAGNWVQVIFRDMAPSPVIRRVPQSMDTAMRFHPRLMVPSSSPRPKASITASGSMMSHSSDAAARQPGVGRGSQRDERHTNVYAGHDALALRRANWRTRAAGSAGASSIMKPSHTVR
jgi:hypothetical protein